MNLIWAVDPVDRDAKRAKTLAKLAKVWGKGMKTQVFPAGVLTSFDMGLAPEAFPIVVENLERFSKRDLMPFLKKSKMPGLRGAKIFAQKFSSRTRAVQTVVDFAADKNAEAILASTHGRRGFERLTLGSFVEKLMVNSPVPVVTVNPRTQVPDGIRRILFPTDFSPDSTKAFRQALKWARRFKASVTIYNLFETPVPYAAYDFSFGGGDPRLVQMAMDSAQEGCRESGDKLVLAGRKLGVPCEFVLQTKYGLPEDGILKQAAKCGADLIVLTSSRGPLSQRVFGRVTKDVLSRSTCPVVTVKV